MEGKNLTLEKLKKFEELVERLERISNAPRVLLDEDVHSQKTYHEELHHHEKKTHKHPHKPLLPHERKELKIDFLKDRALIESIFGDEDTSKAVVDIITTSPQEIQIVIKIVIDLYKKINSSEEK